MSNDKYTKTFVMPNGLEVKMNENYMGRYYAYLVGRKYQDEEMDKKFSKEIPEEWLNPEYKKVEKYHQIYHGICPKTHTVLDTYIIAEDKNWVEYPAIKYYTGEHAMNCKYSTKVQIDLMDEEYSRRIFMDWNGKFSAYDFIENAVDNIWEDLLENASVHHAEVVENEESGELEYVSLQFYTEDGDSADIEIERERDLEMKIIGIKVVEFTQTIIDKMGEVKGNES